MNIKVIEYNNLKSSFDAKTGDIEDKYRDRIDDLINDTAQLRYLYTPKSKAESSADINR